MKNFDVKTRPIVEMKRKVENVIRFIAAGSCLKFLFSFSSLQLAFISSFPNLIFHFSFRIAYFEHFISQSQISYQFLSPSYFVRTLTGFHDDKVLYLYGTKPSRSQCFTCSNQLTWQYSQRKSCIPYSYRAHQKLVPQPTTWLLEKYNFVTFNYVGRSIA